MFIDYVELPDVITFFFLRAVSDIFSEISSRADKVDVSVSVSFVELYREQLYDLLSSKSAKKEDCVCDLREDPVR